MKTLKLAVLGSPIAHSRTPQLQACFAAGFSAKCGVSPAFSCERIETTRETLEAAVRRLISDGYDGFNCTMPLKTDMTALSDTLSADAKRLSSVNTVTIKRGSDGIRLLGDTTDGSGIILTIKRALGADYDLRGKNVILLGAGGAARSAGLAIKDSGAKITIFNRSPDAAGLLADMLGGAEFHALSDGGNDRALNICSADADILVNCTALGMSGKPQFGSLDFVSELPARALVIDAVYNPLETALLKAAEKNHKTMSGLWMLVYQGALAFEKWTGWLPDDDCCLEAYRTIANL